ncbi:hypothetical protein [uncultured Methanobrevibacter sp.]|uniref:hypothetical protein n=1 Tax=uncultured Methanobrevibacter sp. TaxID=253161 RepID=UPI0025EEB5EA|nr:hypothetical protein [uncultured Methanobrevibacter sp.]
MTSKTLTKKIPYQRTVWVTGFAKTISSTTLITLGIGLLLDGLTNHLKWKGYNHTELTVGILSLIMGVVIVILIDLWKDKKKKEELEIIDKTINEKAEKIAERKILEAMSKLDKK